MPTVELLKQRENMEIHSVRNPGSCSRDKRKAQEMAREISGVSLREWHRGITLMTPAKILDKKGEKGHGETDRVLYYTGGRPVLIQKR